MGTLSQDLRYGWRMLLKNPGFTAIAVLTLALGIGATSTIFSWINSTLLDPIPGVAHTGDLVTVMRGERTESPVPPFSYLDYVDLRERNHSLSGLMGYFDDAVALTGTGRPERLWGTVASTNYFDVLGVRPILGRGFLPEEEKAPGTAPVVVISYGLWQSRFGGSLSAIGKRIEINRHPYEIVGVAPRGFGGAKTGLPSDVWIPLTMDKAVFGGDRMFDRKTFWLNVLGRLRPGVDRRQAERDLNLAMRQIVEQYPAEHINKGSNEITLDPLWRSPFGANVYLYASLPILLAIAAVVLLLACANVANLLLVRSVTRRREIAIRQSMGANRWRLMRQLLLESLLLALAGGGIAILITSWTAETFAGFIPPTNSPIYLNGRMNGTVIVATLVMSILTSTIFGILPALRSSSSAAPHTVLSEESTRGSGGFHKARLLSGLVAAQVALSFLLLICAGLFVRSLQNAQKVDPGFDPNNVLLASYELRPVGYSQAEGVRFHEQLLAKLGAIPGVESATLSDWVPLSFNKRTQGFEPEGYVPRLNEWMEGRRAIVGPNYFRTMRIPLAEGREFSEQDAANSRPVAVVDQAFADRYWPGQEAIGKRIHTRGNWFTVVGVARNSKHHRLNEAPEPILYLPLFQSYRQDAIIHLRVAGNPLVFASAVERAVHALNPDLPVFNVTTLKKSILIATTAERVAGTFVGSFGLLALVLAAIGIYGVVAYTTRQRTHEIGIRLALGAQRRDVFGMVLRQGLALTLIGLTAGLVVSLALTRFLRGSLFGVAENDTLTFAGVALLLCLVSLASCYIPAWRAARLRPMVALRS